MATVLECLFSGNLTKAEYSFNERSYKNKYTEFIVQQYRIWFMTEEYNSISVGDRYTINYSKLNEFIELWKLKGSPSKI